MFQIARSDTIIHPGTMMIHPTNTAIADATVMTLIRWFVGLTQAADRVEFDLVRVGRQWHGGFRYGTRIGQRRFGVGRQGQGTNGAIHGSHQNR